MTHSDSRGVGSVVRIGWAPVMVASLLALYGRPALAAEAEGSEGAGSRQVVIAPAYKKGGLERCLWGSDYRALWAATIAVEVLDLKTFAGGLKPLFRVGGQETKGLAMKGGDGRDYTFRGIDKDPTQILPEDLRDTWARSIVQDQIAAQHPAAPFIADELGAAAGILRTPQRLMVMPDDPALGEFRKDFAGLVGQVYEFPGAKSDKNPGFQGATELLKHDAFYKRMEADPKDRPDARAFLKARLFDILIGDWDRHRDQFRWAKLPGQPLWQPIPDDRDQAFSRYEGLVLTLPVERERDLGIAGHVPRYDGPHLERPGAGPRAAGRAGAPRLQGGRLRAPGRDHGRGDRAGRPPDAVRILQGGRRAPDPRPEGATRPTGRGRRRLLCAPRGQGQGVPDRRPGVRRGQAPLRRRHPGHGLAPGRGRKADRGALLPPDPAPGGDPGGSGVPAGGERPRGDPRGVGWDPPARDRRTRA